MTLRMYNLGPVEQRAGGAIAMNVGDLQGGAQLADYLRAQWTHHVTISADDQFSSELTYQEAQNGMFRCTSRITFHYKSNPNAPKW